MSNIKMYAVKIKVSANRYKTKFLEGISLGRTPKEAEEQALKMLKKELQDQNSEIEILFNYEVTKCIKLRTDFIIDSIK
ncbi:hypothetical protein [Algoriella sp.]|uniref:hypothetical protein n=1 Tax=Algoriella sp. TaxID=1872434 RepID=UPI002FCB70FD